MASIGYARVSTREQNPDGQTDLLAAAGCEKVFVEHASGVLAKRPALDDALDYLRSGDTLVVTKLDRLGRSVRNLKEVVESLQQRGIGLKALSQGIDTTTPGGRLFFHMLAAIAEFEHDLIVERTQDGLAAARARGRKGGGRFKMTATKARQARAMYDEKSYTVQQIAETFGVSRGTIYRHLAQDARPMRGEGTCRRGGRSQTRSLSCVATTTTVSLGPGWQPSRGSRCAPSRAGCAPTGLTPPRTASLGANAAIMAGAASRQS